MAPVLPSQLEFSQIPDDYTRVLDRSGMEVDPVYKFQLGKLHVYPFI
jgi:hypothetical protein